MAIRTRNSYPTIYYKICKYNNTSVTKRQATERENNANPVRSAKKWFVNTFLHRYVGKDFTFADIEVSLCHCN